MTVLNFLCLILRCLKRSNRANFSVLKNSYFSEVVPSISTKLLKILSDVGRSLPSLSSYDIQLYRLIYLSFCSCFRLRITYNIRHVNIFSQVLMDTFNFIIDQLNIKDEHLLPYALSAGVNPQVWHCPWFQKSL